MINLFYFAISIFITAYCFLAICNKQPKTNTDPGAHGKPKQRICMKNAIINSYNSFLISLFNKINSSSPAACGDFPNNKAANLNDSDFMVEVRRLELLTSCVQGKRSTN